MTYINFWVKIIKYSPFLLKRYINAFNVGYLFGLGAFYIVKSIYVFLSIIIFIYTLSPLTSVKSIKFVSIPFDGASNKKEQFSEEIKSERIIKEYTLTERYEVLAGKYYYSSVVPHLATIDKVLTEKGLENDKYFIQAMFFIGQRESHWNPNSVSGYSVGKEHPTGVFQFLPSTFKTVSNGNIYNIEDQIRAYITMVERGRVDEFSTLFLKELTPQARGYVLNYK